MRRLRRVFASIAWVPVAAVLLVVMSYSSATVSSPLQAAIVTTDEALLALDCGSTSTESMCSIDDGVLRLDFSKGEFGLQAGSTYTFYELVLITNHSRDIVDVTLDVDDLPVDKVALVIETDTSIVLYDSGHRGAASSVRLNPGEDTALAFQFSVHPTAFGPSTPHPIQVTVSAVKAP